jgi:hypothetical protein
VIINNLDTASFCILSQEIASPFQVFEEGNQFRRAPPMIRVENMFKDIQSKLPGVPQFILCVLPDKKNSDLYGPWKKKNLTEFGIVTQCMAPTRQPNDQYLTNLLLKINAKVISLLFSLLEMVFASCVQSLITYNYSLEA